jgi:O-acetyl-ADP-ribose deacetylase (regulator of RNase III)
MIVTTVEGDLLNQDVQVIVNAWNRNIIPWWLLLPQGVSGAIKRRGGLAPFRELARMGPIPWGGAVVTGPGRLPFEAIIHVAGINMLWRSSEAAIRDCVRNAMEIVDARGWSTVAFPVIGAGSGGFPRGRAREIMLDALETADSPARAVLVYYPGQS